MIGQGQHSAQRLGGMSHDTPGLETAQILFHLNAVPPNSLAQRLMSQGNPAQLPRVAQQHQVGTQGVARETFRHGRGA